ISVLMNVVSICRNRSGEAWASCSCRKAVGSILLGAVIVFFSWIAVEGVPEDHAVAAFTSGPHPGWGPSYTTLADATCPRSLHDAEGQMRDACALDHPGELQLDRLGALFEQPDTIPE